MTNLPIRLRTQPLVESLLEIRVATAKQPMPLVLPGLVFSKLSDLFSETDALPLASIPREIRQHDPSLKYQTYYRVLGEQYVVSIGDNVIALSTLAPYAGWEAFRSTIKRFLAVLADSGLIQSILRYSMKSLNIIPAYTARQLDMITLRALRGDEPVGDNGFRLRCELNDERWVRIIEVTPNSTSISRRGDTFSGLSLNVDCIKDFQSLPRGLDAVSSGLDELHNECKALFFSLLTVDTLTALGPTYAD